MDSASGADGHRAPAPWENRRGYGLRLRCGRASAAGRLEPVAGLGRCFDNAVEIADGDASVGVTLKLELYDWAGRRKRAFNRLAIDRISAMSKEELSKVDRELEGIVVDLPRLRTMIR